MKSPFLSLCYFLGCISLAAGLAGCSETHENDEALRALEEELAILEGKIEKERIDLQAARDRYEEEEAEASIVRDSFAPRNSEIVWRGGNPSITGEFVNSSALSASSATLHVTLVEGMNVVKEERFNIEFDPILLPGARAAFSVEASPFIWGFQDGGQRRTEHRFTTEAVVLASGKTLKNDFSAVRERQAKIDRLEAGITALRLEHGAVHTKVRQTAGSESNGG